MTGARETPAPRRPATKGSTVMPQTGRTAPIKDTKNDGAALVGAEGLHQEADGPRSGQIGGQEQAGQDQRGDLPEVGQGKERGGRQMVAQ